MRFRNGMYLFRICSDFNKHFMPVDRPKILPFWNKEIRRESFRVRKYETEGLVIHILAHHSCNAAGQNACNIPFHIGAGSLVECFNEYCITVERTIDACRRNENIVDIFIFHAQEAESSLMHGQLSFD